MSGARGESRIGFLTAGAAGMYCGSCMRDNTLVAALHRMGVDIQLIPTYTPIRTDEDNVAIDRIFFGGINVYLQQKWSLFRWLPGWFDRLLDQPWLINALAARGMQTSARELGELTVAMLAGEHGAVRKEVLRLVGWLESDLRPQLLNFTNILIGGSIPLIKKRLGIPIVVTLQGDDLFLADLPEPYQSRALERIRQIGEWVDAFVVYTDYYADFMADWVGLDRAKMHRIPLGIETESFAPAHSRPTDRPPTVGYFARICPAKGFHLLVDAFIQLRSKPGMEQAELLAGGWLGEGDRAFFEEQRAKLAEAGLESAFSYEGVLDRDSKHAFFHRVDLLCVPTTYREPKGLFVLESLASGVPVVVPDHGSFPELLAVTKGGELVPPNDAASLANVLAKKLADPAELRQQGMLGRQNLLTHCSADIMARQTLALYDRLLDGASGRQP